MLSFGLFENRPLQLKQITFFPEQRFANRYLVGDAHGHKERFSYSDDVNLLGTVHCRARSFRSFTEEPNFSTQLVYVGKIMWFVPEELPRRFAWRSEVEWLVFVAVLCFAPLAESDDSHGDLSDIDRLRADILPTNNQAMKMVRPVVSENATITLVVTVNISDLVSFELDKSNYILVFPF